VCVFGLVVSVYDLKKKNRFEKILLVIIFKKISLKNICLVKIKMRLIFRCKIDKKKKNMSLLIKSKLF